MKKSKKILSIVLAVAVALSVLATVLVVTATAKETLVSISVDKSELSSGESATVSVLVTSNYPIATMSIPVFYDKTLVDVSNATATLTDYSVANAVTDSQSVDSAKVYDNTGVSDAKFGFVLVNYIGEAGADVPENIDGVVLTFTITAKENVNGTAVIKCATKSKKTDSNAEGMLYFGATVTGGTINEIPENVENVDLTNATQNIDITSISNENRIKVKEDFVDTVIVDTEVKDIYLEWYPEYEEAYDAGSEVTGFIYGAEVFDVFLEDVLTTAYGDECLVITRTELAGDYDSTGTKIEVVDTEGNVLETYYYIYFGDLNCDGILDAEDVNLISTYNREGEPFESLCVFIASDYNGDTFTDGQDVTDVITANNSGEMVDQAAVAATFYEEYHAAL